MAPEMHIPGPGHKVSYTKAVDIWAVGCVLFEIMTLTHPFLVPGMSEVDLMTRIASARYDGHHPCMAPWSAGTKDLLDGMLKPGPSDRLSTAAMMQHPVFSPLLQEDVTEMEELRLYERKACHGKARGPPETDAVKRQAPPRTVRMLSPETRRRHQRMPRGGDAVRRDVEPDRPMPRGGANGGPSRERKQRDCLAELIDRQQAAMQVQRRQL